MNNAMRPITLEAAFFYFENVNCLCLCYDNNRQNRHKEFPRDVFRLYLKVKFEEHYKDWKL